MDGAAAGSNYLKELREAGANTARIYDTINLKATLDEAQKLNLAVVVDIPLPKYDRTPEFYENDEKFSLIYKSVEALIKNYKDHPALLYWNLGNEIFYPYLYNTTSFYKKYNSLIDLIHQTDPNHPVSTSTIGANKLEVVSITLRSPELDFISFNSFGTLSRFKEKLYPITPIWNGPHVITEWGVNGPWEALETSWGAPIEETSTKKAQQIVERYHQYIEPLKENNSIGNFVFYWGQKNEVTPTWYSLFHNNQLKSQAVFELEKIWKGKKGSFPGPILDYLLMDGKGALDNVILIPSSTVTAEIFFPEVSVADYTFHWELRHESWYDYLKSRTVPGVKFDQQDHKVQFGVPGSEGPYRLHLTITNNTGYFASANIPFYVLAPGHED